MAKAVKNPKAAIPDGIVTEIKQAFNLGGEKASSPGSKKLEKTTPAVRTFWAGITGIHGTGARKTYTATVTSFTPHEDENGNLRFVPWRKSIGNIPANAFLEDLQICQMVSYNLNANGEPCNYRMSNRKYVEIATVKAVIDADLAIMLKFSDLIGYFSGVKLNSDLLQMSDEEIAEHLQEKLGEVFDLSTLRKMRYPKQGGGFEIYFSVLPNSSTLDLGRFDVDVLFTGEKKKEVTGATNDVPTKKDNNTDVKTEVAPVMTTVVPATATTTVATTVTTASATVATATAVETGVVRTSRRGATRV